MEVISKEIREWIRYANARKTFNNIGERLDISNDTREILLGHLGKRTIHQHYNNYKLPEVINRVDKAHIDILERFKTIELIQY